MTQALIRAGGPAAAGSFRNVSLRRGNQPAVTLDLYDMLLRGERGNDRLLQADDVIHVGPVGPLVGLIGSVNKPAVFELKPGDTVADVLRMAGGFNAVADTTRLSVERLDERNAARDHPARAAAILRRRPTQRRRVARLQRGVGGAAGGAAEQAGARRGRGAAPGRVRAAAGDHHR